jgi:glyoxylase-like metal-dependent hydrolase (beta-lactamase superfamily II)
MFLNRLAVRCAAALSLLALAVTVAAQQKQDLPENTPDHAALTGSLVKTGLYMFSSAEGNAVLRLSGNGFILVDGKFQQEHYEVVLKDVRKIVKQPVRVLILTDHCELNVVKDSAFLQDGTRVIAQEKACEKMASESSIGSKLSPLIITYKNDYQLRFGGVEAQLMHFGSAYSSGDTVVYFPNLKAVAVGNLFASSPVPDFSRGGSLVGWGAVLGQVLKLDFDVAVPAKGTVATRADIEVFKSKIDTLVARATGLVKGGVAKDQLMSQLKTEDLGWTLSFTPDQIDRFYSELSERGIPVSSDAAAQKTSSQLSDWRTEDLSQSIPLTAMTQ